MSRGSMKKASAKSADDLRPEYDFASMKGGVRGKDAKQYRAGINLALLDPKLTAVFPTDAAVYKAMRLPGKAPKANVDRERQRG